MSRPLVALGLTLTALAAPLLGAGVVRAQATAPARTLETSGSTFNINAVQSLLAKGDAAAAAGNLTQANTYYDQARDICRKLITWYVGLAGSFRGLDARIPREMDLKGREVLELQVKTNLRLAAVYRRMNQPEIAVPLLVEVVKLVTPASEDGRKAYQTLVELGFVSTPYAGPTSEGGK
ncbi:MAG: hypothetical protein ACKOCM_11640 [Cyanobacteriota bacterium]